MATVQTTPRAGEFKPEYGAAEVIAFKFTEPKIFPGTYGERGLFTLTDERKFWCDADDASDIYRELGAKGIQRNQPFRLTKIRHPRGGGHSFRVEALAANAPAWVTDVATAPRSRTPEPPTREEMQLEQSLALTRAHGAQFFQRGAHVQRPAEAPESASPFPPATAEAPARTASHQLMSAYLAAIDAVSEAQAYADRKGLKVTFSSEDVRATAISCFIQAEKAMLAGRY